MFVLEIFYVTWRGDVSSDFDEIWQAGPSWVLVVGLRKLAPDHLRV